MLYELIPNLKAIGSLLSIVKSFRFKSVISLSTNNLQGILMWEEFIDMGIQIDHELKRQRNTLSFDDPINIQFTTTGSPKRSSATVKTQYHHYYA
jgi:fatty-acyl-CoA synthase